MRRGLTLSSASPWPLSRSSLGPREAGVFLSYFICHLLVKGYHLFVVVVQSLSRVRLSATPRTAARQASLSSLEGCKFSLLTFLKFQNPEGSLLPKRHRCCSSHLELMCRKMRRGPWGCGPSPDCIGAIVSGPESPGLAGPHRAGTRESGRSNPRGHGDRRTQVISGDS